MSLFINFTPSIWMLYGSVERIRNYYYMYDVMNLNILTWYIRFDKTYLEWPVLKKGNVRSALHSGQSNCPAAPSEIHSQIQSELAHCQRKSKHTEWLTRLICCNFRRLYWHIAILEPHAALLVLFVLFEYSFLLYACYLTCMLVNNLRTV